MIAIQLVLACSGQHGSPRDTAGEADPTETDGIDEDPGVDVPEQDVFQDAGPDGSVDVSSDTEWTWYDGELPNLPRATKDRHVASCMRSRACSSSPQQLGTCTAAFAHVQGRMIGIVLGSVADCVANSDPDCEAITACLTNGEGPTGCEPLVTPDRCDGTVLRQCSRASGVDLVVDCAGLGLDCFIDTSSTATCGLGVCDPATFRADCHGDTLVLCDRGVIVVALCDVAGLACVQEEGQPGLCAGGGTPCSEDVDPRRCEGDLIVGCIGGSTASVDCTSVVDRWTCGPRDGTFGCVPSGDECQAEPLFGTDLDESCSDSSVTFCMDGFVTTLDCEDFAMGPCTDLGSAARCTAP